MGLKDYLQRRREERSEQRRQKKYYESAKEYYRKVNTGRGQLSDKQHEERDRLLEKRAQMEAENERKHGGKIQRAIRRAAKAKRGRASGYGAYGAPRGEKSMAFGESVIAEQFYAGRAAQPKGSSGRFQESTVWPGEFTTPRYHHEPGMGLLVANNRTVTLPLGTITPAKKTSSIFPPRKSRLLRL